MTNKRVTSKAISLLLTFVLLNVFVLTGARTSKASTASTAAETTSSSLLVGYLSVAGEQAVLVNGNEAGAGTTIVSGVRLETPAGVNAVVQLGSLGSLSIEPNTNLLLDFSKGRVEATVTAGEAVLTTREGVTGTLTTADGSVLRSDAAKAATLSGKKSAVNPAAPKLTHNQKLAAIIIPIVAAVVIIAVVVANRDDDSPRNP